MMIEFEGRKARDNQYLKVTAFSVWLIPNIKNHFEDLRTIYVTSLFHFKLSMNLTLIKTLLNQCTCHQMCFWENVLGFFKNKQEFSCTCVVLATCTSFSVHHECLIACKMICEDFGFWVVTQCKPRLKTLSLFVSKY